MNPHHLGLELRQLVLRQRLESRDLDTRRLQAAIGDLCGAEHRDLVGPLRYLVLSAAFASAAGQEPPLGDPRLLGRLQQELAQMYAERLCQRLQPVLEGLLGMAAAAPDAPLRPSAPVSSPVAVPGQPAPLAPSSAALRNGASSPVASSAETGRRHARRAKLVRTVLAHASPPVPTSHDSTRCLRAVSVVLKRSSTSA